eukprot:UN24481
MIFVFHEKQKFRVFYVWVAQGSGLQKCALTKILSVNADDNSIIFSGWSPPSSFELTLFSATFQCYFQNLLYAY